MIHSEHIIENHSKREDVFAYKNANQNMTNGDQKQKHNCTKCKESFKLSLSLKLHTRNFHGDRECNKCSVCGVLSTDNEQLKNKIQAKHTIHGGDEKRLSGTMESSDERDDECSSGIKTPQAIYKEHEWRNEE